jgi:uncharacterized protein YyaL (SSP411 family)
MAGAADATEQTSPAPPLSREQLRGHGDAALAQIERLLRLPDSAHYAEAATPDGRRLLASASLPPPTGERPAAPLPEKALASPDASLSRVGAFNWPAGVQLSALAAAARIDPARTPDLVRYADALQDYWLVDDAGLGGYNAVPGTPHRDRYYDDNAWIVLALLETHEITGEKRFLDRAIAAMRFVLSGEDDTLGGGIYWNEARVAKHTCSNAPAAAAALRLYAITRDVAWRDAGLRLYAWTRQHLRDPADELYIDWVRGDGASERHKWSYNSALMIRAGVLAAELSGDASRLAEARVTADAAIKRWCREDGAIADDAAFAHLLAEALLELHAATGEERYREAVDRALRFLATRNADPAGLHPKWWHVAPTHRLPFVRLIDQASAARAYHRAAR